MSGLEQVGRAELIPVELVDVYHLAELCAAERQERLEGYCQVGNELERYVEDSLHALHVGLCNLPRLAVGYVLVADACKVHGLLEGIAELEVVEQMLNVGLDILKLLYGLLVDVLQFAAGRHYAVPVFLGELQRTVYKVAVDAHQFAVVALLEVFPCEVVVLCLGRIGCQHIAQHVLLAGQFLEVFMKPYRPVA